MTANTDTLTEILDSIRFQVRDVDQRVRLTMSLKWMLEAADEIRAGNINEALVCHRLAESAYSQVTADTRMRVRDDEANDEAILNGSLADNFNNRNFR